MKHINQDYEDKGRLAPQDPEKLRVWDTYARLESNQPGVPYSNAIPVGPFHALTAAHIGSDGDLVGRRIGMDGRWDWKIRAVGRLPEESRIDIAVLYLDGPQLPRWHSIVRWKDFEQRFPNNIPLILVGAGNTFGHVNPDGFIVGGDPTKAWGEVPHWRRLPADKLGPDVILMDLKLGEMSCTPDSGDSGGGVFAWDMQDNTYRLVAILAKGGPNRIGESAVIGCTVQQAFDIWGFSPDLFSDLVKVVPRPSAPVAEQPAPVIKVIPPTPPPALTPAPSAEYSEEERNLIAALRAFVKAG